jgi:uncharacterized damage-inducible protein DinB
LLFDLILLCKESSATLMNLSEQLASRIRTFYDGDNWTGSSLWSNLDGLTWTDATTPVYGFNSIAVLLYHINYYVSAFLDVTAGKPLLAKDEWSFEAPPIHSQPDLEKLRNDIRRDAESFARVVEQMPEGRLWEDFSDGKYGNYYHNIQGILEHSHYHLGQIVLIRKIFREKSETIPRADS